MRRGNSYDGIIQPLENANFALQRETCSDATRERIIPWAPHFSGPLLDSRAKVESRIRAPAYAKRLEQVGTRGNEGRRCGCEGK